MLFHPLYYSAEEASCLDPSSAASLNKPFEKYTTVSLPSEGQDKRHCPPYLFRGHIGVLRRPISHVVPEF